MCFPPENKNVYKKVTGQWVGDFKQQMKSGTIKNRAIFVLLPESFGLRLAPSALNLMRFSEVPFVSGLADEKRLFRKNPRVL